MSFLALKSGPHALFFLAHDVAVESAAREVTQALPPGDPGVLADALLPAFLKALPADPIRAFICVEGAAALHLAPLQGFRAEDIGAGDVMVDAVLALPLPCVPRGVVLAGRRSALASPGAADHIVVSARTATEAASHAAEISAAVPDTNSFEAEETWDALSAGARLASKLKAAGQIYGAAITHKGRGRIIGALDPNPLFRLRVSDWR